MLRCAPSFRATVIAFNSAAACALPAARPATAFCSQRPLRSLALAPAPVGAASTSGRSACIVPRVPGSTGQKPRRLVAMAAAGAAAGPEKKVLVPIANGSEEMEAVIIIDVLRRAGAHVTVASVEGGLEVTCSRNVKLVADKLIGDCQGEAYDLIALPGGMPGAEHLRDCALLESLLRQQAASGKLWAAICATPVVMLQAKGLVGPNTAATAHPAFSDKLTNRSSVEQRVVVDGTLTTSRGPGTAFEFALSLVKQLYGEDKMKAVAGPMVM